MAETNVPTGTDSGKPTTEHSDAPPAGSMADLLREYAEADAAFGAVPAETVADEHTDAYQDAQRRYHAALNAARDARPTALAELAAQLSWIVTDNEDLLQDPMPAILSHTAQQLEAMAGQHDAAALDADLIRLGRDFDAAVARVRALDVPGGVSDDAMDASVHEANRIGKAMVDHRATTLQGVRAKARALSWYSDRKDHFGPHGMMTSFLRELAAPI